MVPFILIANDSKVQVYCLDEQIIVNDVEEQRRFGDFKFNHIGINYGAIKFDDLPSAKKMLIKWNNTQKSDLIKNCVAYDVDSGKIYHTDDINKNMSCVTLDFVIEKMKERF